MARCPSIFFKQFLCCLCMIFSTDTITAQNCPPNIDFENGSFSNWTCLTGYVTTSGSQNIISLSAAGGPVSNRHTVLSRANSIGVNDVYAGFPVLCPNGSGYSVKLGNNGGGHEAEGISYQFTIPSNRNVYSLVYYYAVVFENPNHLIYQQPRLEIEVNNLTDNKKIDCSSFTFIPFGSPLPGFFVSPVADSVLCKDWTPVTINLNGNAGKTIELTFKTADCTFNRHFGYAYIDVNTECSGEFSGAAYCVDDTAVNVVGPYGFQSYNWYDQNFTTLLGTQQTLTLQPPPPSGTRLAVELIPYNGYGCVDTMFATLNDTLTLKAHAGPDALLCLPNETVQLGEPPKPNVIYAWSPPTDLYLPIISNPIANPTVTRQYILSIRSTGGGCRSSDTVIVKRSYLDTTLHLLGKNEFCITSKDSAVLLVNPGNTIKWFNNGQPIGGANGVRYRAQSSGSYYAQLVNTDGCVSKTRTEVINIETPAPGKTYAIEYTLVNEPITLNARDFGGSAIWSPNTYLDNPFTHTPVFKSPFVGEQNYQIGITSKAGCATRDFQTVKVLKEISIYVPNAFTPNGDGLNDYLYPITIGASITAFKIYNRWGQEVFSLAQDEKGWNGKLRGVPQETGTYVWYLQGVGIDKRNYSRQGTVTLIR
jgi:gliding motility-associated-like protein